MENFQDKIMDSIQRNILKGIQETSFIERWNQGKISIPTDIVQSAFAAIDRDVIFKMVKEQIEEQIAKTIVGQLLTETATDTKRIMSDPELRQQIKNKVYPQILKMAEEQPLTPL